MFEARLSSIRALFLANLLFLVLAPITWTGVHIGTGILIYYTFGCLGIVASFHRYYSHNAFQFRSQTTRKIWTLLGHLAGSGSALGWAAIHHRHHAAPDTEEDPHSPIHGFWKTMFLDYGQGDYRSTQTLLKDSYLVFLHKNYFLVLAAYCAVLFTLFGIQGLAFGFCLPSVITLLYQGSQTTFPIFQALDTALTEERKPRTYGGLPCLIVAKAGTIIITRTPVTSPRNKDGGSLT